MRKWLFGILILGLLLLGCVATSKFSEITATEPTPDPFQLTATKLIADATQTAVAFESAGCTKVLRPVWDINEIVADRETQSVEVYANSYEINAWVCDGELTQTRALGDYSISLITFEEAITGEVAAPLIERALELVGKYLPDDTMLSPISVSIFALPNAGDFNPTTDFVLRVEFTYEDAIAAYESGLRGVELLDALGIEVPE